MIFTRVFIALIVPFFWLDGGTMAYADGHNAASGVSAEKSPRQKCSIEYPRGKRAETSPPGRLKVYWREMPLRIACGPSQVSAIEKVVRMPRDRWLPITVDINDNVMASLDPAPGYRFRKPARMTITLYSRSFESEEARNLWYNDRSSLIERSYAARYRDFVQRSVDCTYDSTCADAEEEFEAQKAAAFKELDRQKENTWIAAFTPAPENSHSGPVIIDNEGQKLCLVRTGSGQWNSRPCNAAPSAPEMQKVTVDGKVECLFRMGPKTWETRPCPN